MRTTKFWLLFGLAGLLNTAKAQDQPNFVLIYVDDLNYSGDALGGQEVETPNVSRITEAGVNFRNAHANGTICAPSRASMLTGIYPHNSGFYGYAMGANHWYQNEVLNSVTDIFAHFKNQGYAVYGTGKLFHGAVGPYQGSFTEYFQPPSDGPWAWDGESMQGGAPVLAIHPSMPPSFTAPVDGIAPLSDIPEIGNHTGWILSDGTPYFYESDENRDPLRDEVMRDYAVQKITQHDGSQPLFLSVGFSKPHLPFYLPKKYFDLHPIDEIVLPPILDNDLDDAPVASVNNRWNSEGNYRGYRDLLEASADSSDQQWWLKRHMQGYYAGVSFLDDMVGDVLDALDAAGMSDNTYIIYTSDHGYHLGDKTYIKKTTLYEEVTRVPFVISGPLAEENASVDIPVSQIDFYPTLTDLAGIPNPPHTTDGFSLRPLLENPDAESWEGPAVALCGTAADEAVPLFDAVKARHQHHSVRSETMRYTLYSSGEEELFDHAADPNEWFNLAGDADYAAEKAALRQDLIALVGPEVAVESPEGNNILKYGGFEQDFNGWIVLSQEGPGAASIQQDGQQTEGEKYALVSAGDFVSLINANVVFENGTIYTVLFDAKAETDDSGVQVVVQKNGDPDFENLFTQIISLDDSWQTYAATFEYEDPTQRFNNRIRFNFPPDVDVSIDNVRVGVGGLSTTERASEALSVKLFPNPGLTSGGEMNYALSGWPATGELRHIRVYNLSGKLVHSERAAGAAETGTLSLATLKAGVYFVQFSDSERTVTAKMVLE